MHLFMQPCVFLPFFFYKYYFSENDTRPVYQVSFSLNYTLSGSDNSSCGQTYKNQVEQAYTSSNGILSKISQFLCGGISTQLNISLYSVTLKDEKNAVCGTSAINERHYNLFHMRWASSQRAKPCPNEDIW